MSKTIVFQKSSMPYGPGDVATFDDAQADRYLTHSSGVARLASTQDIEVASNTHRKPSDAPAVARAVPEAVQVAAAEPAAAPPETPDESDDTPSRRRSGR